MNPKEERALSLSRLARPHAASIPQELIPLLPANWPVEIPLARVSTCGPTVSIEVLQQITSGSEESASLVYGPPDASLLAEKGTSTALILLSLLASQPHCSATRDWLSETLGHLHSSEEDDEDDREERPGLKRVDNVVTHLRHLLFPPMLRELPTAPQLRRRLVLSYRASGESGPGYRLAGLPLLWVDVDAISEQIKQARALEQFGHDGLPTWQLAYEMAGRGVFLAQEPYSDWASWRRQQVEAALWDCVQVLWQQLANQGEAGEREAVRLLQRYWQNHLTSEDALRPLIELLGKRECYGQAEEYYAHLCLALEQEGKLPDQRTQQTMTFLRALQIQRQPPQYQSILVTGETERTPLEREKISNETADQQENSNTHNPPNIIAEHLRTDARKQLGDQSHALILPSVAGSKYGLFLPDSLSRSILPTGASSADCAIWFGIKQAQIITDIVQWKKHALFCDELQGHLDQEMRMFDQMRSLFNDEEKYSLSRRQVLISIAMLPVAFLKTAQQGYPSGFDVEEFLPRCTASTTAMWHLLTGREFIMVEDVLVESIATLFTLARKPSPYQEAAAHLASQNCLLMSLLSRHRGNNLALDEWYSREAVFYSEITTNRLLQIATLKHLADTYYYREQYRDMLLAYERAWNFLLTAPQMNEIPSLLHARISSGFAYASAKNGDAERAKSLLSQAHETFPQLVSAVDDQTPLYADCGVHSLYLWEGLTRRLLNQPKEAEKTFTRVEQLPAMNILVPERTRVEIITHQAATAIVQGNMEAFCFYFMETMDGIASIHSEKRRQEAITVYKHARQEWPDEKRVLKLADLFAHSIN